MKTAFIAILAAGVLVLWAADPSLAAGQPDYRTPWLQENILRTAPDEAAPFVTLRKPAGGIPTVEVLSRQGEQGQWEEVRLTYRFKYNGSTKPGVCAMSLYEGTFTGFRLRPSAAPPRSGRD